MSNKGLPISFDGDEEEQLPRYIENSWNYVSPPVVAASKSTRTESEVRAGYPSPSQERLAAGIWGDKAPPKRDYTQCCDCPGHFPTSGNKKRCSPCSDIHAQAMARARCKAARAILT